MFPILLTDAQRAEQLIRPEDMLPVAQRTTHPHRSLQISAPSLAFAYREHFVDLPQRGVKKAALNGTDKTQLHAPPSNGYTLWHIRVRQKFVVRPIDCINIEATNRSVFFGLVYALALLTDPFRPWQVVE